MGVMAEQAQYGWTETENMKLLFEQCLNMKQVLILMIGPTNLASSEFQKMISVLADQTSTQKSLFTLSSRTDRSALELFQDFNIRS